MSNVCTNQIFVSGPQAAVEAFFGDTALHAGKPWSERNEFGQSGLETDPILETGGDGIGSASYVFATPGKPMFDEIEAVANAHPGVVVAAAAVELANGIAQAKVWAMGTERGTYEMSSNEIEECAGPEQDGNEVFDCLYATVAAYEHDALEEIQANLTRFATP